MNEFNTWTVTHKLKKKGIPGSPSKSRSFDGPSPKPPRVSCRMVTCSPTVGRTWNSSSLSLRVRVLNKSHTFYQWVQHCQTFMNPFHCNAGVEKCRDSSLYKLQDMLEGLQKWNDSWTILTADACSPNSSRTIQHIGFHSVLLLYLKSISNSVFFIKLKQQKNKQTKTKQILYNILYSIIWRKLINFRPIKPNLCFFVTRNAIERRVHDDNPGNPESTNKS